MSWNVGPPTAFWWPKTSRMMVYESARYCSAGKTYWPPSGQEVSHSIDSTQEISDAAGTMSLQPYSNHSYIRIRDMTTGAVVGNVQGSDCFSYGSAVVDPVLQRAWVFGSERDTCHQHKPGGTQALT